MFNWNANRCPTEARPAPTLLDGMGNWQTPMADGCSTLVNGYCAEDTTWDICQLQNPDNTSQFNIANILGGYASPHVIGYGWTASPLDFPLQDWTNVGSDSTVITSAWTGALAPQVNRIRSIITPNWNAKDCPSSTNRPSHTGPIKPCDRTGCQVLPLSESLLYGHCPSM